MKRLIGCLAVVILALTTCGEQQRVYYSIKKGKFTATLTETGELMAVNSRVLVMPWLGWQYGRLKVARIIEEGTPVKPGDFVLQIDTTSIVKVFREKENDFQIAQADLRNLLVNHENELRKLQGQLASAEASYNLAQIQLEKIRFESPKRQKISELQFEKEKIALEKVQKNLEALQSKQQNELLIQQLKLFKLKNEIDGAQRALNKTVLEAPIKGFVEYKYNRRTRQKIRAGDELWPGSSMVGIPDLSQMKVKAQVNETDISKISLGQKVIVRLDAFPNIPFDAQIIEVAKLCHTKDEASRRKQFDITVLLEKSDPILKPGMTVSCEIWVAELPDVFYVPNECLAKNDSLYFLYLKKGTSFEKKPVQLGPRNNEFTVIYGNFKAGQPLVKVQELNQG